MLPSSIGEKELDQHPITAPRRIPVQIVVLGKRGIPEEGHSALQDLDMRSVVGIRRDVQAEPAIERERTRHVLDRQSNHAQVR